MFGSDGSPIIQYIVIFAVIFTVLAAIVFLVRRLTGGGTALQGRGSRARQPRLGIIDVYELDRARQLILLRRDNVEHLLLVGGPNDVVIERNIQRGQRPLPETALRPEPAAEPLPDPMAEAGRLPEPPRAIAEAVPRRAEPPFEMPVVVPAPVPGSQAVPPVRLPLDAALIDGDEPGRDIPVPPPSPLPEREGFPRPRTLRSPPPAAAPAPVMPPALPSAPPSALPAAERQAERSVEGVKLPDTGIKLPPLSLPPSEPRAVDPSVLSDMARQLQAAIARPSSAVTLPTPSAAAPEPVQKADAGASAGEAPEARIDPIAAAMASTGDRDASALEDGPKPPAFPPTVPIPPQGAPAPRPAVPTPPPARAARPPEKPTEKPKAAAMPPIPRVEAPMPRADTKSPGNPFSVEEIEAEFARLLGRPLDNKR